jgi:hypothetical protein
MRTQRRHVHNSVIVVGAIVMSLALPVTALLSREENQLPEVRSVEFAASIPAASIAVSPMSREILPSHDHTSQTVSMVIVGSLLIGVGSAIRRSV